MSSNISPIVEHCYENNFAEDYMDVKGFMDVYLDRKRGYFIEHEEE